MAQAVWHVDILEGNDHAELQEQLNAVEATGGIIRFLVPCSAIVPFTHITPEHSSYFHLMVVYTT